MHLLSQNNFTHHFYCQCNLRISPFEGRNVPKSLKSLGTFPSLFAANGFPACAALLIINHPLPTANHLCFINILAGVRGAAMSPPCLWRRSLARETPFWMTSGAAYLTALLGFIFFLSNLDTGFPHGLTFNLKPMSVVNEPIENSICKCSIAYRFMPEFYGKLARHNC